MRVLRPPAGGDAASADPLSAVRSRPSWRRNSVVANWVCRRIRCIPGTGSGAFRAVAASASTASSVCRRQSVMSWLSRRRSSRTAVRATATGSADETRTIRCRSTTACRHARTPVRTTRPSVVSITVAKNQSSHPTRPYTARPPATAEAASRDADMREPKTAHDARIGTRTAARIVRTEDPRILRTTARSLPHG